MAERTRYGAGHPLGQTERESGSSVAPSICTFGLSIESIVDDTQNLSEGRFRQGVGVWSAHSDSAGLKMLCNGNTSYTRCPMACVPLCVQERYGIRFPSRRSAG